jgi:hypothetical protein
MNHHTPAKKKIHLPSISLPMVVFSVVLMLFIIIIISARPEPVDRYSLFRGPMQVAVTPTLMPSEWLANARQAEGIAFGGVILVMIVVVGTLGAIRTRGIRKK